MIVVDSSAVDALRRQEEARKAREDRMRNALEILAGPLPLANEANLLLRRFVRATAREGLGRETE
jgi:uncharacterized protein with PIN domain